MERCGEDKWKGSRKQWVGAVWEWKLGLEGERTGLEVSGSTGQGSQGDRRLKVNREKKMKDQYKYDQWSLVVKVRGHWERAVRVCVTCLRGGCLWGILKKQKTPQHLEHLQNALLPEDKEFVPSITHRKSGFFFNSIPSRRGSLGTAVVVGPRALAV